MYKLPFKDILHTKQFTKDNLSHIFETAKEMELVINWERRNWEPLSWLILGSLFYEPSTRTRLSFETAMKRLGWNVITVAEVQSSSFSKWETLEDNAKIIATYADLIVMRHHDVWSVDKTASVVDIPVINAGDGHNQHPTQALLDLYTIYKEKWRTENLKVAIVGDLKYWRTAHSLVFLLWLYNDIEFVFISPDELKMPEKVTSFCKQKNIKFTETDKYQQGLTDCDVAYITRVQKERFADASQYEKLKERFILKKETLKKAKKDIIIMHPLPRVKEVDLEVDELTNAVFFKQAANGVPIRMALLYLLSL